MKIAFLNFYSGYHYRGGEVFIHELAKRLAKNNDVLLVQAGPKIEKSNYQIKNISGFTDPAKINYIGRNNLLGRLFLDKQRRQEFSFTIKSHQTIKEFQPDIIIPLNGAWQTLLVSLYCRFTGKKFVVAGQSGPGWDDRFNLLVKPNLFVALTKRQLTWAKQTTIWKQDFVLIPNGVDLDQFKPEGKKAKVPLSKPIIMIVAASTPDKRVEQGIRAVARLKGASLLLLGKGTLDERINKLGYKLLGKDRFFHACVTPDQMPEHYRSADIFSLCSESSEAFGIVYLEAMASGLPVVATDDKSRHEIVGEAGLFVKDPDNESEYSEALSKALKTDWGERSLIQATKFSWEKIAKEYERVFNQLVK